ncbi:MAG: fluoride efflux transporter CrcB [Solirubrobacteraceae bacterium]
MSPITWIGVAGVGGLGALARFLVDGLIGAGIEHDFPIGSLAINLSGAFLLGLVTGLAFHGDALVLAGTATLGSYTTFSTWMLETHRLREEGEFSQALANTLVSLILGLGAVAIGRSLGAHG